MDPVLGSFSSSKAPLGIHRSFMLVTRVTQTFFDLFVLGRVTLSANRFVVMQFVKQLFNTLLLNEKKCIW